MSSKFNVFSSLILTVSIFLSSVSFTSAIPEEGMFTPDQINKLPLQKMGLKIKPTEIYNPNGVDLADAVMRINIAGGGFGTGEFVSPNGLILTNHHVGFDALVEASSPEKNYGDQGYRANSQSDELPATGYSILITNRVANVTAQVLKGSENLSDEARTAAIKRNIEAIQGQEQSKAAKGATIRIQELNSGYYYYLYETISLNDVRIVYSPPKNIGFFGGDPDNFEWTRHTGDFMFMRAYTAPDGSSAEYSPNNVPYKPKKFLTISLAGLKENDFVFVLGYPGTTTRYRESQSVEYSKQVYFPFLEEYFRVRSNALRMIGEENEEKRIKLQGDISNLDNVVKVYEGGQVALRRGNALEKRREQEAKFAAWTNADPARKVKYGEVLPELERISTAYYQTPARDRLLMTFPSAVSTPHFKLIFDAIIARRENQPLKLEKRREIETVFQTREPILEREVIKFFLKSLAELPPNQKFQPVEKLFERFQGKDRRAAEEVLAESIAENKDFDTAQKVIELYNESFNDLQEEHPNVVELVTAMAAEKSQVNARTAAFNKDIDRLRLLYQQGMAEMNRTTPYPDANASLRFSYGRVKGYEPREAVIYEPFTTLKGVIEKDKGVFPFDVPQKLKDLQRAKDFGGYRVGDSVPVNFLTTTDIIGGNSGSPVLNAYGEQVGIVFDGNYEGLGNDIFFSNDYGRTIAVDIRYVLFVTEKFGNAGWILNEMNIKGRRSTKSKSAAGN